MSSVASLFRSRRARWAVPAGVAVVGAAVALGPVVADASPSLPHRTAAQLLADLASVTPQPFSGTVVETARLGLPDLPQAGDATMSPAALLTGSHTVRLWSDGPQRTRVAMVGDLAETDLIRNGTNAWLWTSGQNTAEHVVLPAEATAKLPTSPSSVTGVSPTEAAKRALAAIDPSTAVSVDGTASVAGRSAYELVLTPRASQSLVHQVRLAVDSRTSMPLRVEVFAKGVSKPAFETAFTSVSFSRPDAAVFRFTPPPGAKVTDHTLPARPQGKDHGTTPNDKQHKGSEPVVHGKAWTTVVELKGVDMAQLLGAASSSGGTARRHDGGGSGAAQLQALVRAMRPVSGSFGSGQLLTTRLVSVLVLNDGRAFVGAVTPQALEDAAS